jgi:chromosome segregation and condensation protein ScpB
MVLRGNKIQTNLYLTPVLYSKLEKARGKMPRSTYIEDLLEKKLVDVV